MKFAIRLSLVMECLTTLRRRSPPSQKPVPEARCSGCNLHQCSSNFVGYILYQCDDDRLLIIADRYNILSATVSFALHQEMQCKGFGGVDSNRGPPSDSGHAWCWFTQRSHIAAVVEIDSCMMALRTTNLAPGRRRRADHLVVKISAPRSQLIKAVIQHQPASSRYGATVEQFCTAFTLHWMNNCIANAVWTAALVICGNSNRPLSCACNVTSQQIDSFNSLAMGDDLQKIFTLSWSGWL